MALLSAFVLIFFAACFGVEGKPIEQEQFPGGYQMQAIMNHNYLRAIHRAGGVDWNRQLAEIATTCILQLVRNPSANLSCSAAKDYGVNVFAVTVQDQTPEDLGRAAFGIWAEESNRYDFNRPGYSQNTARFTQMVWQNTTDFGFSCIDGSKIGSALSYCVGIYSPAGNKGDFSVNVLEPVV